MRKKSLSRPIMCRLIRFKIRFSGDNVSGFPGGVNPQMALRILIKPALGDITWQSAFLKKRRQRSAKEIHGPLILHERPVLRVL